MRIHVNESPPNFDGSMVALDIEMFGQKEGRLHLPEGTLASLQLCADAGDVWVFTEMDTIREAMESIQRACWIGHNIQYDLFHLRRFFPDLVTEHPIEDTMLLEKWLYNGYYDGFALKDLVRRYFGVHLDKEIRDEFETATEMTKEQIRYAADDAYWTFRTFFEQVRAGAEEDRDLTGYHEIDIPSVWSVLDIQPIKVNKESWITMVDGFDARAKELEAALGFNVKSVPQVKAAVLKATGIVLENTQKDTLEAMSGEIFEQILEVRKYRDAVSKYGYNWIEEHVDADGFVRSNWIVTGAETGRMASRDPNLENIPSKVLPEYREQFIQSKGCFTIVDISAQEPRILAHETQDKELLNVFKNKEDIHLIVARAAYKDDTIQKDDPRRKSAKSISLGTTYGLTSVGLSKKLNCSEDQAQEFLDNYFQKFPDIRLWIDSQRRKAQRDGYVTTASGRRCWISPYKFGRENNAINAPCQGGAADFTKLWVILFRAECKFAGIPSALANIIHDELVLDHPVEMQEIYHNLLESSLQAAAAKLYPDVPFVAEYSCGETWADKK